jgi:hypothetical protein
MSHPDPLFDPENSYEDDDMNSHFDDYQYDYRDAFYGEDTASSHPDADHEVESQFEDDGYDDSMDGDHDSAMTSCGWGTDEDYGYFGENDDDSFYGEDY